MVAGQWTNSCTQTPSTEAIGGMFVERLEVVFHDMSDCEVPAASKIRVWYSFVSFRGGSFWGYAASSRIFQGAHAAYDAPEMPHVRGGNSQ